MTSFASSHPEVHSLQRIARLANKLLSGEHTNRDALASLLNDLAIPHITRALPSITWLVRDQLRLSNLRLAQLGELQEVCGQLLIQFTSNTPKLELSSKPVERGSTGGVDGGWL